MATCWRCGRILTDTVSIKLGIGPVCAMAHQEEQASGTQLSLLPSLDAGQKAGPKDNPETG